MDLGMNLRAFVSQRLVPTIDGKRCAAVEILLGTKTIQELILRGKLESIKEIMEKSERLGMRTFDGALYQLYRDGRVSADEALKNADSPNNLRLRIKLGDKAAALELGAEALDNTVADQDESFSLSLESIEEPEEDSVEQSQCFGVPALSKS
jgi:twitching motility protein PilU